MFRPAGLGGKSGCIGKWVRSPWRVHLAGKRPSADMPADAGRSRVVGSPVSRATWRTLATEQPRPNVCMDGRQFGLRRGFPHRRQPRLLVVVRAVLAIGKSRMARKVRFNGRTARDGIWGDPQPLPSSASRLSPTYFAVPRKREPSGMPEHSNPHTLTFYWKRHIIHLECLLKIQTSTSNYSKGPSTC
jgi:hypothetical protein